MAGLDRVLSPEDSAALTAWRLGPILTAERPATGTVNRTVLVRAAGGAYALRAYRRTEWTRVQWEHAALGWAAARDIPVCRPVPLPDGATVREQDGHLFALFPLAPGRQVSRTDLGEAEIAAAGRCLARIHLAFADFPRAQAWHKPFSFDTAGTLELLARIRAAVPDADREALRHLEGRRRWLLGAAALDDDFQVRFAALPQQVVHGDFQETNLFFKDGEVSAVIDWDQCGVAPRAWEVLRALHLMLDLAPGPCRIFLDAYRGLCPLPHAGLEEAAICYGALADQNLWVYAALYLEGNDRVRAFVAPGGFVPFAVRWQRADTT